MERGDLAKVFAVLCALCGETVTDSMGFYQAAPSIGVTRFCHFPLGMS